MSDIKQFEPLWGTWVVESFIGQGSFGKVYKVRREAFEKMHYAAVKIITIPQEENEIQVMRREGHDTDAIRRVFQARAKNIVNEIDLMREFHGNSHIVSCEDYQIIEDTETMGWNILIRMELLTSLADSIGSAKDPASGAGASLPEAEVVKLGIHMCKALELCAVKKIVHRDIKPDNIFISSYGDYKLGDFGIARQIDHTAAGLSLKGTNTFMAPEVYKNEPYGSGADIYSLGIVMYGLLNHNRSPFLPPYPQAIMPADRESALRRRMSGEMVPRIEGISSMLNSVVQKACAYHRQERFADPQAMREALETVIMDTTTAKIEEAAGIGGGDAGAGRREGTGGTEGTAEAAQKSVGETWWKIKHRPIPFQTEHAWMETPAESAGGNVVNETAFHEADVSAETQAAPTVRGISSIPQNKSVNIWKNVSAWKPISKWKSKWKSKSTGKGIPAALKASLISVVGLALVVVIVFALRGYAPEEDPLLLGSSSSDTWTDWQETGSESNPQTEAGTETGTDTPSEPGTPEEEAFAETPLASDDFDRSAEARGFGRAPLGGTWLPDTRPGLFSTDGNCAVLTVDTAGWMSRARLRDVSQADIDVRVSIGVPQLPEAGTIRPWVSARTTKNFDGYLLRANIRADGGVESFQLMKMTGTTSDSLHQVPTNIVLAPGEEVTLRLRVVGSSLQGKAWKTGTPEPENWPCSCTDTALTGAASVGVGAYIGQLVDPLPVKVTFDNFVAIAL